MISALTNPAFWTALGAFCASLGALIMTIQGKQTSAQTKETVLNTNQQVTDHGATLNKIQEQTNGTAAALQQRIDLLETVLAEMRTLGLTPKTLPPIPNRRATDPPAARTPADPPANPPSNAGKEET